MNRQKMLLTLLAGLLVLAVGYAIWATPRQARVTGNAPRRPAAAPSAEIDRAAGTTDEKRVRLELLSRENGTSPDFKRNIFRFWQPPPRPLPPPPPPPAIPTGPPLAAEEVQRELARFTFLGFLVKDGVRTIFLSAGDEIFIVKKGDRFGNGRRFLVAELTPDKLTIRQNDEPRPIIVPLVEQAPLAEAPSFSPAPEPPARMVPMRRRGTLLPEPPSEDQQPVELTVPPEPAVPLEPTEQTEPAEPAEPAGQTEPVKDPFAVELKPPSGVEPQRGPQ